MIKNSNCFILYDQKAQMSKKMILLFALCALQIQGAHKAQKRAPINGRSFQPKTSYTAPTLEERYKEFQQMHALYKKKENQRLILNKWIASQHPRFRY